MRFCCDEPNSCVRMRVFATCSETKDTNRSGDVCDHIRERNSFFSLDSAMRLNVCKIALCGTEHFWGSFVFSFFCVGATVVHGTAMEAANAIASSFEMR